MTSKNRYAIILKMKHSFKTIALMGKQQTPEVANTLNALIAYLTEKTVKKVKLILEKQTALLFPQYRLPHFSHDQLGKHADLLIVVGGDGSLLSAARSSSKQNLPLLGVNCGRLGFLNDISPNKIAKVSEILHGKFSSEERFLLNLQIKDKKHRTRQDIALNDVALLAGTAGHMIDFSITINNNFVCKYRADGLIVATPTGSTAHALSGGGPILHPELNAIALVPMFSHNLSSRPIVINAENHVIISLAKHNTETARVSCDGQMHTAVTPGCCLHITKAQKKLHLIHPLDYDYFAALRTKLDWEN